MSITPDEISRIKRFEGSVDHLYLDITGHVTIGYGHLLQNQASAVALALLHKTDSNAATDAEKQTEWTTITAKSYGQRYAATYYDQFCKLSLQQADIDQLLTADLSDAERQISAHFAKYAEFPQAAKAGLVDMAFNLGATGLITGFPNFIAAVQKQDWATAADECNRPQLNANRNTEVKQLFLEAAKVAKATNPPVLPTPTPTPVPPLGTGSTGTIRITSNSVPGFEKTSAGYRSGSQYIVDMVSMSSNVTTAAIEAITAIADNYKKGKK